MTQKILLADARRFGGVEYPADSIVDVADDTAAALIAAGLASYVASAATPLPIHSDGNGVGAGLRAGGDGSANAEILRRLVARGGVTRIEGPPGIYTINGSIALRSRSRLIVGPGITLRRADAVHAPFFKNEYCGCIHPAASFVRSANVVTVNEDNHTFDRGQRIWIDGGPTSSFRGLVTVIGKSRNTWRYVSSGADGAAGSSTQFYNVIPTRRVLAPGAMIRDGAGLVTVTDPGHDVRAGDQIYVGAGGADTTLTGLCDVITVSADAWKFVSPTAGALTSSTEIALSYDQDISIVGDGVIDGNRTGNSAGITQAFLKNAAALFGCVNRLTLDVSIGGSPIRGANIQNCVSVLLGPRWSSFDALVGVQFEGGGRNLIVDQARHGQSAFHTTTAQQSDDYVAFTGTKNAAGAVGNYDNVVSPYGLRYYEAIDVRRVNPVNALNAVKLAAHSDCPFRGGIHVGAMFGHTLNTASLLGTACAIKIFDDGPGLAGTTIDVLDISGPGEWYSPDATASGEFLYLAGAGSINLLRWRGGYIKPLSLGAARIAGMTVQQMVVEGLRNAALGANKPAWNCEGGTIRNLTFLGPQITVGTSQDYVYLNGSTINNLHFVAPHIESVNAGVGGLVRWNAGTLGVLAVNHLTPGAVPFGSVLISDKTHGAASTVALYVANSEFVSANLITTPSSGTAANLTCTIRGTNVKWTAAGGGNFLQVGTGSWIVRLDKTCDIQAGRIALFSGFGTPAYRIDAPSVGIDMGATFGAPPATFSAPATGDMIINTNGTGGGLGVRTAAGAWSLV